VSALLIALLLAVPASAAACGDEGGEDTAPLISEAKLSPPDLPSEGGTGAISVRVADDCGVRQVIAKISRGKEAFVNFELLPAEDINSNARVYRGEFQVPANLLESPVDYRTDISAEDTNGALVEAYVGKIEVAGVPHQEAPQLFEPSVAPSLWGGFGGTSRIGVRATDDGSLADVYAIVTYPDSSEREIALEPFASSSSSSFGAPLVLPANPSGDPRAYPVAVFAEDDTGLTTGGYAGTVTVEPKGTPNPGFLALEPGYLRFGSVSTGQSALLNVVVRNSGKPGSPPVSGFLRTSDPQFFLPGATDEGLSFTLDPGEERTIDVGFQPTAKGQQVGRLTMARTDGRQPNTGVSLFGWGVNRQRVVPGAQRGRSGDDPSLPRRAHPRAVSDPDCASGQKSTARHPCQMTRAYQIIPSSRAILKAPNFFSIF
jgi:hypothetical protein